MQRLPLKSMKLVNNKEQYSGRAISGFSLIEVLAAVAIIGIITFLALPNILRVQQDSEVNLAIARAEALNIATASYIQATGFANAKTTWDAQSAQTNPAEARYDLISPYLSFAEADLANFMPAGYTASMPTTLVRPMSKVPLLGPDGPDSGTDPDSISY